MTDRQTGQGARKKTPRDASEFEREQLRFLLSGDDVAATLAAVNPSLAWLPVLRQMKLIQAESQLVDWVERNFSDMDAVRDVVANLHLFGPDAARFLEFRLNSRAAILPPLLVESWQLIIRHMQGMKQGLRSDWFEIAPQVKRGDHSAALLERIAEVLRPQLRISERVSFDDSSDAAPQRPSDLMKIDYEVSDGVTAEDVLEAWPKDAPPETDSRLLAQLTSALAAAVADATDVRVESNDGYSTSDFDVPSVAEHPQNTYRSGFHPIVRVIAELWTRLARKSPAHALPFVRTWADSGYRLMRRLALFACADRVVSADSAADMLVMLPIGELFLTNSSVETYRLIRERWKEFAPEKRQAILRRLCEGPPRDWFREGSEIDTHIDRSRFDVLGAMERDGFEIAREGAALLKEIRARWPRWQLRPAEQTGFHIWQESGPRRITGDAEKLQSVSDDELVTEAKKIAATADFLDGDSWQALCLSNPDRALRGLNAAAATGDWAIELWHQLLWARKDYAEADTEERIAQLLLQWPTESFGKIAAAASSWLDEHAKTLKETLLWPLWDRIADATLIESEETGDV